MGFLSFVSISPNTLRQNEKGFMDSSRPFSLDSSTPFSWTVWRGRGILGLATGVRDCWGTDVCVCVRERVSDSRDSFTDSLISSLFIYSIAAILTFRLEELVCY